MDLRRIVHSGRVRFNRRIADLDRIERRRAKVDHEALGKRFPWLIDSRSRGLSLRQLYGADHEYYCREIGHPVHAASMELVVALLITCESLHPKRVIDLGSGFTSYALRRWAVEQEDVEVWSVDDSAEWLEKTRDYLRSKGLGTEHTMTWPDFLESERPSFDLVLHDMGMMDTRARTLETVLELARPGGLVVLDDVHKPVYRRHALSVLEARDLEHYSMKVLTRDALTRYAELVVA